LADYPTQMKITTEDGERILEKIYFTELGHVMAKIFDPKTKTFLNRRIGNLDTLLLESGIKANEFISLKSSTFKKMAK
jgi:hypothetical protein